MLMARVLRNIAVAASLIIGAEANGYELKEPHVRIDEQAGFDWISDEEILFQGFALADLAEMRKGDIRANYAARRILYVVNISTGAVREHAPLEANGGFCFSAGTVLYRKSGGQYWFGKFGEERGVSRDVAKHGIRQGLRCGSVDVSKYPPWPSEIFPLLAEDGVLELRLVDYARRYLGAFLWKPGATEPVFVTSKRIAGVQYVPFKHAYFTSGAIFVNQLPAEALWLHPDGKVEASTIPGGRWTQVSRAKVDIFPSKAGWLVSLGSPEHVTYLLPADVSPANISQTKRMRTVFRGIVWGSRVSPDGCKFAVATGPRSIPNTDPSRLEIIELCR